MTAGLTTAERSLDDRWAAAEVHRPRLLKVAARRTVSAQEAEDVVAEALLRAVEHPELDEDHLATWLTTVTVRLCTDTHRDRQRERRRWLRTAPPSEIGSSEQAICDRAEADWLATRLADLPDRQEQALRAKASGLDVPEVARSLGVSYGAAESLLSRGRAAMRSVLAASLAALVAAFAVTKRALFGTTAPAAGWTVAAAGVATVLTVAVPHQQHDTSAEPTRAHAVHPVSHTDTARAPRLSAPARPGAHSPRHTSTPRDAGHSGSARPTKTAGLAGLAHRKLPIPHRLAKPAVRMPILRVPSAPKVHDTTLTSRFSAAKKISNSCEGCLSAVRETSEGPRKGQHDRRRIDETHQATDPHRLERWRHGADRSGAADHGSRGTGTARPAGSPALHVPH